MKVILEPSVYELTDFERDQNILKQRSLQIQHISFLSGILNYIISKRNDGCDLELSFSQNQYYGLCNNSSHPWNQYTQLTNKNELMQTYLKIMQLSPKIDDFNDYISLPNNQMQKFSLSSFFDDFCKHIGYVYLNKINYIVFYGRLNKFDDIVHFSLNYQGCKEDISFSPIYEITELFNDSIRKILLSNVKYNCIPTVNSPLPNIDICRDYIDIKNKMIKDGNDTIEVYRKIGTEVALRNNYKYDELLTHINSNNGCIRHIFKSNSSPYLYLSIDVRHGNFEVCDSKGYHIDEYTYDNVKQNKHDSTGKHDIKLRK